MAFMKKEELLQHAEELSINLEGLSWQEQQRAVIKAMNSTEKKIEEPSIAEEIKQEFKKDPMAPMRNKEVLIAPEMAMTPHQLFGYEEELGDDLEVSDVMFDIDSNNFGHTNKDLLHGGLNVIGKTGKKVVAKCGLPKSGAGITFRPDKDVVPVVTFKGRSGYLWTHQRFPNIKALLIESGYYEKYKHRFVDEPYIWHAAGRVLACDISLVHSILREIETDAQRKIIEHNI